MKNVQIFYNCAFCRVGVLVWVDSDHARRDGQGTPTHLPSQGGNTPKQFYCVIPSTAKTLCCPVSHCYSVLTKADICFAFHFHPGTFSLSAPRHPSFPYPVSFLPENVRSTYIKLWNLRIWRYFLILQGCICIVPCYLLLYYYSYNINLLTSWYLMPFPYK